MTESPHSPAASQVAVLRRGIRWDAAAAIVASLVGLLALIVAGYTAYIQREQVRAQVWPYLMMANSDNSSEYMWLNKGVGPAQVKSVRVFVNGEAQTNWAGVVRAMKLGNPDIGQSTLNGNVFSAGEKLDWLQFKDHGAFQAFREAAKRTNLRVEVCYCSTLGDCWTNDSSRAWNDRHAIGECPAVAASQIFDD